MNLDILRFQDVTVCHGSVCAVENLSAELRCGSLMALVGPNGAGKSTLLRSILGWHDLKTGRILLGDDHAQHQNPRLCYVPQRVRVDLDYPATVRMIVEQGRFPAIGSFRGFREEDNAMVERAIQEMGLEALAGRRLGELSGGQQQRVFLARALAQGGDIFLLDEPFEGVDAVVVRKLIEQFHGWCQKGRTILAAVHDLTLARESFDQALLMNRRLIASGPSREALSQKNIALAYGISHSPEVSHE